MVRLTRIYTRGGDRGETSLGDGSRVAKQSLRVEAFGTVDEANAAIGLARLHVGADAATRADQRPTRCWRASRTICSISAPISARPEGAAAAPPGRCASSRRRSSASKREIDAMNAALRPLDSFILPGGTPAAAHLHLARTVTRRAERLVCALAAAEPVNPEAVKYLNRLSDHLFVLGRRLNDNGARDVLWRPGATR